MTDAGAASRRLDGLTVLIVDDNQNMRRLLHTLLRAIRITEIREADSGKDALAILTAVTPDLILTDLAMKPLNGLDFVRLLRSDRTCPAATVPVIMLTGYSEETMVMKARAAGVNDFVAKPVSANVLRERIERVIFDSRNVSAVR
jgi:CheY-like chemotaxis protein